jgi:hypothetical protein
MARRGRFARQTGGSDLSTLIYSIMQQQYARTTSAIIDAYKNQTDYRGNGIPSADEVIAYLRSYASNSWVSQNDRDNVSADIAAVQRTERSRQENIMVSAINEDPANADAIRTYMAFLSDGAANAETPSIAAENRDKLFDASKSLLKALGSALGNGAMSVSDFDAQASEVVNAYSADQPNRREVMSLAAEQRFSAQYNVENTLLATAAGQGAMAYNRQLRRLRTFLLNARKSVVAANLGTTNANGDIIGGAKIALEIQKKIGEVNSKLTTSAQAAVQEAAQTRIDNFNTQSDGFLKLVNNTLGSSYNTIEDFATNQLDVNRFYAIAPAAVMSSVDFIKQDTLVSTLFGTDNSILAARKSLATTSDAAAASYAKINALSKNYGRNTLVDDAAILFDEWYRFNSNARGESISTTKKTNELIARYEKMIAEQGGNILPEELVIHQRTIALMRQAAAGEVPEIDGPTAWDLANPNASSYDAATGKFNSVFGGTLKLIADDAVNAADIAAGKVQVATIAPDGKWQYKAAVDPTDSTILPIVDSSTGITRFVAVGGVELVSPSQTQAGEFNSLGRVYNLGGGKFVVETLDSANAMTTFATNYDPFSGKQMSWEDFQRRYTQRSATGVSTGDISIDQFPQFVVPPSSADTRTAPVSSRSDLITENLDTRIKSIAENTGIAPDAQDRIIGAEVRNTLAAVAGTPFQTDIEFKYKNYAPLVKEISKEPSFTASQKQEAQNAFRASERDGYKADALASFAFRNSPISAIFSPSATKAAKDGLEKTTVKGGWGGR